MLNAYSKLRAAMYEQPLILHTFDAKFRALLYSYLPFSVGIEVECSLFDSGMLHELRHDARFNIPHIMSVDFDDSELRFRIPAGLEGFVCLYHISLWLKEYALLNSKSGIHYHIDFTKYFDQISQYRILDKLRQIVNGPNCDSWVLKELDTWNYTGSFNQRRLGDYKDSWIKVNNAYHTLEYRIGEMTFDYEVLVKRIIHASSITQRLGNILMSPYRKERRDAAKRAKQRKVVKARLAKLRQKRTKRISKSLHL